MAENDISQRLTFLYKIIDDNQATIRFLDTKAAFGIAVLGAMVGRALDPDQLAAFGTHGLFILLVSFAFALFTVVAAALGFRTVFPTVNPAENVSFPDNLEPRFFIFKFKPERFWRYFSSSKKYARLEVTHSEYCDALNRTTAESLASITAAEALKLSFIRQLKTDRLTAFSKALIGTVILFMVLTLSARKPISPAANDSSFQGVQSTYYTITGQNGFRIRTKTAALQTKSKGQKKVSPNFSPKK
jgi:hypothetical protein